MLENANHGHASQGNTRVTPAPGHMYPGASTAVPTNVSYRLSKLAKRGLLRGVWLDCGCADGGYTVAMARAGVERAIGVDLEVDRVGSARARNADMPIISYGAAASESLPFADASFNGVFLNEVLEHVSNEMATLREAHRVLRPGGYLALMSPNRWFPFEGHGLRVGKMPVRFPVPFVPWLPSGLTLSFMCARNYWPHELEAMVRQIGFELIASSSVLPVFEVYRVLPASVTRWYQQAMPALERLPFVRRFGVSTFVLGRRPVA